MWHLPEAGTHQILPILRSSSRMQQKAGGRPGRHASLRTSRYRICISLSVVSVRHVGSGNGERAVESKVAACVPQRSRITRELCDESCGCRGLCQGVWLPSSSESFRHHTTTESRSDRLSGAVRPTSSDCVALSLSKRHVELGAFLHVNPFHVTSCFSIRS